jgi:hypothetical protein
MTDYANFGTLLYSMTASGSSGSATLIASVVKLDPPAVTMPKIKSTNHGSGSYDKFIAAGVVEIDDFDVTLSYSGSALTTFYTSMVAGTLGFYKLAFPNGQNAYFDSLVTGWKPEEADSQSPELLQVTVTFSPSGTMIIG